MEEIKVSIICNVFNHEKYIRDALEGFVAQKTKFPFEVLVHDDASTDRSAEIIREYEEKYPDIIKPVYQKENQYSKGIKISKTFQQPRVRGKYIAICEGDDYWSDCHKLQKQCDFLDANEDYSMCVCSTTWFNMLTGTAENRCIASEDREIPLEDIILEKNGRIFQLASVMVRSEIWKQWPEWRLAFPIGDLPLAILAGLNGRVYMLSDVMTVYRYYSEGSWTVRMDCNENRARVCRRMIEGFTALNHATEFRYDDVISKRILKHKYTLALMERDFDAIRSGELKNVYNSRGLILRLSDRMRCQFPALHVFIMRLLKRKAK